MKEESAKPREPATSTFLERQVLARICTTHLEPGEASYVLRALAAYQWQEPEHAVVFQAIQSISLLPHAEWREELPAQATRLGFPDVDWQHYFSAAGGNVSSQNLNQLIADLIGHTDAHDEKI